MIKLKSPEEIKIMREGGKILAQILKQVSKKTKAGTRAQDLNNFAEEEIKNHGAEPAFKNYQGFPASLCVSINSEVVHGVPGEKIIKDGDVVGLDLGIKYKGLYTDAAATVIVGKVNPEIREFVKTCELALKQGIAAVQNGKRMGDVGAAIQSFVESRGYSVVCQLVGHGVGYAVHEAPNVPNFGRKNQGLVLRPGLTFCIEPMINLGGGRVETQSNGHTFVTADRSLSAHFEHTVAVTEKGCLVLTKL
ncbi:MAG: type I methionyl aminopeptidase [bacterium]|nr:type I methionyl aminopeptidase [bacterium]